MNKIKILIFIDWFEPGFKAGGPIRSISNFVSNFHKELDIFIITSDRDLGDTSSYVNIELNTWIKTNLFSIFYSTPNYLNFKTINKWIKDLMPKWIYLNSMYSYRFSILPMLVTISSSNKINILLAPRGMLKPSAMEYKKTKKTVYLSLFRLFGFYKKLTFQATSEYESRDIRMLFGANCKIVTLCNLSGVQTAFVPIRDKISKSIKVLYIGRIHPIKNLNFVLKTLNEVSSSVSLTVIGESLNDSYWLECSDIISKLRSDFKVTYIDKVPHSKIESVIHEHHLFFLPSKGENFGHSILESLSAGRPVLISDQTPWIDLTGDKAGWDLKLKDFYGFKQVIEEVSLMNNDLINIWASGAWRLASDVKNNSECIDEYMKLFEGE